MIFSTVSTRWLAAAAILLAFLVFPCRADQPGVTAEALREDLAVLYTTLQEAHYDLYAHRSKDEYDALYRTMLASIDGPVTRAEAAALLQRVTAYGKIGHARIDQGVKEFLASLSDGGMMLPLFMRVVDGRAYLLRAPDLDGRLRAGTEVLRVDGEPVLAWLERVSNVVSAERPYMALAQLEESLPAAAWLELGPRASVRVTARNADGRTFEETVDALSLAEFRVLSRLRPTTRVADFNTREFRLLGEDIAYLRPGPFFNTEAASDGPAPSYEDSAFRRFLDDAFGKILAAGTRDLIIDLRNNPGGDNSFSDPMVAWFADEPFRFASRFMLKASAATKAYYAKQEPEEGDMLAKLIAAEIAQPNGTRYAFELPMVPPREGKRYEGRVYVLVNRHSYSNATTTAALIQDYGFGTIVGEETADVPTTYASVVYFDLPKTGITVTYPKSYIVRPSGDERVRGVVPTHRIVEPVIPPATDIVLERAVKLVRAQRR